MNTCEICKKAVKKELDEFELTILVKPDDELWYNHKFHVCDDCFRIMSAMTEDEFNSSLKNYLDSVLLNKKLEEDDDTK